MIRQLHQMLPTLAYGDAIGNQALEIKRLAREWGYVSEIFAERWDPRLAKACRHFTEYAQVQHPDNLLILHYSIGGQVNQYALSLPDRLVLYYHNITPARFFYQVNGEMARLLAQARRDLKMFAGRAPCIAASPYNRQELESMGLNVAGVIPPLLSFSAIEPSTNPQRQVTPDRRFEKVDTIDWIHVGRLAPNKCIHDIIKAFYYYHTWITPRSRLLMVGTGVGLGMYVDSLYALVTRLGLDGHVIFAGHAPDLASFYRNADLYVSMSEHEGFGIPLIEAMYHNVPVLAFASTGVPSTLGDAGVLFVRKEFAVIAEMAQEIIDNTELRARLLAGQRARLSAFAPERLQQELRACLSAIAESAR